MEWVILNETNLKSGDDDEQIKIITLAMKMPNGSVMMKTITRICYLIRDSDGHGQWHSTCSESAQLIPDCTIVTADGVNIITDCRSPEYKPYINENLERKIGF
jgi:hypothetical protein